ncbi:TATA-binding protein-associated factor 172 [Camelus dromedarius]|uniref:TATA-binding protein-associated factor 172 n=1 Tax=Camelus dromedarius TaxID=9838 RepID=A0A5N4DK04_CAMDR|nr:TATA-binding protein-associated factor 172 [Camelus dromedarius]
MAVSRLDRLFILLDTGTTPVTRKAAAQQLGEVVKLHPHELNNLLSKILSELSNQGIDEETDLTSIGSMFSEWRRMHIRSTNWDTRIAAGQAVEAIVKNVPEWNPVPRTRQETPSESAMEDSSTTDRLNFDRFDICRLLQHGASLLGSAGAEFEVQDEKSGEVDPKERIARQRKLLQKKLGLNMGEAIGMSTEELFNDEDLDYTPTSAALVNKQPTLQAAELIDSEFRTGMSNRQKNKAKRMAKLFAKQRSRDAVETNEKRCNDSTDGEPEEKRRKIANVVINQSANDSKVLIDNIPDNSPLIEETNEWPLESFCEELCNDLFNPSWEVRHGAGTGLREILKAHGKSGGKIGDSTLEEMIQQHQEWLEDLVIRLLCVFALDRFGDFVSDEVVAPVRETCAQTLGVVLKHMNETGVHKTVDVLLKLLTQEQWEVRHGGLLGIKYALAVRQDVINTLLPKVLSRIIEGLQDLDDDVRAVAAASLVPVVESLVYLQTQKVNENSSSWLIPILPDMLRHIFQFCVLESSQEILDLIHKVWMELLSKASVQYVVAAACPWMGAWLCLMMQPSHLPIDLNMLLEVKARAKEKTGVKVRQGQSQSKEVLQEYIAGADTIMEDPATRDFVVMRARMMAAKLLGALCCCICDPGVNVVTQEIKPAESLGQLLLFHLNSKSALQRISVALVICEWAALQKECRAVTLAVQPRLLDILSEHLYYDEIAVPFTRMQNECKQLISSLADAHIEVGNRVNNNVFTIDQANDLVTTVFNEVTSSFDLNPQVLQQLDSKRQQVQMTVTETNQEWQVLQLRVHTFAACAVVSLQQLPEKLNPIIKPLMETIKKEENTLVQNYAAQCIAKLLQQCTTRTPCPNSKIIKNLCSSLCVDPYLTPSVTCPVPTQSGQENSKGSNSEKDGMHHTVTKHRGIITLYRHQKAAFAITSRRGPTPKAVKAQIADLPAGGSGNILVELDEAQKPYLVQRRGAEFALTTIVKHFGGEMAVKLPHLWDAMVGPLRSTIDINNFGVPADGKSLLEKGDGSAQELVNSLQVFETAAVSMDSELHPLLVQHLPHLYMCLQYPSTAVRHMAARCVGVMSKIATMETMNIFLEKVLPWLGAIDDNIKQEGAIEALACVMEQLDVGIVPYIVLLVVPVLGRMSDQTDSVRFMATQCFATLIRLMPLEAGIPDPPNMSEELIQLKAKERHFLEQLLDGKKLENYKIPVPINAELRKYQQDGVNWLAFLNKYKLHGILCDDMGLGKTLQSICILAGDHCHRAQEYARSKLAECMPLPSLVVCPPTLTGHWVDEVDSPFSNLIIKYRLQHQVKRHNLIVASYDVVRNDIDFFRNIKFNYCILDEGHVIKNGKTKLSKAVKQLTANYRIILSGTPIQNNVLELWSLFDFLMPGFLGTERQFAARYGKPILASRDARSSSREQEAGMKKTIELYTLCNIITIKWNKILLIITGVLAMDALHRQVLPFLLRRMKEDVLQDLPPKIIQDYYCTLSPLQVQLYEDFAKSRAKCDVDETVSSAALSEETEKPKLKATGHVFQALQYLRKLCNHPALVLTPQHPEFKSTTEKLAVQNSSLHDIQHAPKLSALKQLLLDCGLGSGSTSESGTESVVAQHRVLIFCQLKSMLDIVEHDLLKPHLPSVTYLRLDGSIPPGQRHSIVSRFNNDPSIDVLLLTTHVGGLGLNLTGADTVVFVEHDWNPMRDLQAMDRAHRIGQKRVVNVYRLITRGTLEEKIMGLQKFKMNIANTVISQENSSLQSMGTDQLLDLFTLDKDGKAEKADTSTSGKASMKSILENLSDLWDQEQYDSEYSLENFMHSLK